MNTLINRDKKITRNKVNRVTVYVRNYAKKAIMLTLNRNAKMEEIRQRIYHKMKVSQEDQALFLNGDMISPQEDEIVLEDRLIFHLVNLKRVFQQKITITVKTINPEPDNFRFTIPSSMTISDFITSRLTKRVQKINEYFLIYTGRQLKPLSTFQDQFIEDLSELTLVHKIKNLKDIDRRRTQSSKKANIEKSEEKQQKIENEEVEEREQKELKQENEGKEVEQGIENMEDILEEEEKERKKSSDSIEDIYISSKQQYSKIKNNQFIDKNKKNKNVIKKTQSEEELTYDRQQQREDLVDSVLKELHVQPKTKKEQVNNSQIKKEMKEQNYEECTHTYTYTQTQSQKGESQKKEPQQPQNNYDGAYKRTLSLSQIAEEDEMLQSLRNNIVDSGYESSKSNYKSQVKKEIVKVKSNLSTEYQCIMKQRTQERSSHNIDAQLVNVQVLQVQQQQIVQPLQLKSAKPIQEQVRKICMFDPHYDEESDDEQEHEHGIIMMAPVTIINEEEQILIRKLH